MQRPCMAAQSSRNALLRFPQRPSTGEPVACTFLCPSRGVTPSAAARSRAWTYVCSARRIDDTPEVETHDAEVVDERGETGVDNFTALTWTSRASQHAAPASPHGVCWRGVSYIPCVYIRIGSDVFPVLPSSISSLAQVTCYQQRQPVLYSPAQTTVLICDAASMAYTACPVRCRRGLGGQHKWQGRCCPLGARTRTCREVAARLGGAGGLARPHDRPAGSRSCGRRLLWCAAIWCTRPANV